MFDLEARRMINLMSKNNVKTISTFHNVYGGNSFIQKYITRLSKMDHLIAISDYVKAIYQKIILRIKISVINRGLIEYLTNLLTTTTKKILFWSIKLTSQKNCFFPARLTRWKGQLNLSML